MAAICLLNLFPRLSSVAGAERAAARRSPNFLGPRALMFLFVHSPSCGDRLSGDARRDDERIYGSELSFVVSDGAARAERAKSLRAYVV